MNLVPLCDVELRYTSMEVVDYAHGGQIYGTMEGELRGDRLRSLTFRTGATEYTWLNSVFTVLEGVLDSVQVGGVARGRAYICEVTL